MLDGELRDLYQDVILDHQQNPHNYGELEQATHEAEGYNPLCGDRIHLYLEMDGKRIERIGFKCAGCAISTASASLMTDAVVGLTREDASAMSKKFRDLVTGRDEAAATENAAKPPGEGDDSLGKLHVLAGVKEFPMRVKCATLAWHALQSALNDGDNKVATTE